MLKEADFEAHEEIKYHAAVSRLDQEVLWWPIVQVHDFVAAVSRALLSGAFAGTP